MPIDPATAQLGLGVLGFLGGLFGKGDSQPKTDPVAQRLSNVASEQTLARQAELYNMFRPLFGQGAALYSQLAPVNIALMSQLAGMGGTQQTVPAQPRMTELAHVLGLTQTPQTQTTQTPQVPAPVNTPAQQPAPVTQPVTTPAMPLIPQQPQPQTPQPQQTQAQSFKVGDRVTTPRGTGVVTQLDPRLGRVTVRLDDRQKVVTYLQQDIRPVQTQSSVPSAVLSPPVTANTVPPTTTQPTALTSPMPAATAQPTTQPTLVPPTPAENAQQTLAQISAASTLPVIPQPAASAEPKGYYPTGQTSATPAQPATPGTYTPRSPLPQTSSTPQVWPFQSTGVTATQSIASMTPVAASSTNAFSGKPQTQTGSYVSSVTGAQYQPVAGLSGTLTPEQTSAVAQQLAQNWAGAPWATTLPVPDLPDLPAGSYSALMENVPTTAEVGNQIERAYNTIANRRLADIMAQRQAALASNLARRGLQGSTLDLSTDAGLRNWYDIQSALAGAQGTMARLEAERAIREEQARRASTLREWDYDTYAKEMQRIVTQQAMRDRERAQAATNFWNILNYLTGQAQTLTGFGGMAGSQVPGMQGVTVTPGGQSSMGDFWTGLGTMWAMTQANRQPSQQPSQQPSTSLPPAIGTSTQTRFPWSYQNLPPLPWG